MQLDSVWRLIYGIAAVPAAFVTYIRFTIPETPRFVYDVQRNAIDGKRGTEYLTTTDANVAETENSEEDDPDDPLNEMPPLPSWYDFKEYFFKPGGTWTRYSDESSRSWTTLRFTGRWPRLLGTSATWFLLDFSFFGLGLNNSQIVTGLYKGCRQDDVSNPLPGAIWNSEPSVATSAVSLFEDNEYAFWLIVSIAAISGSLSLILLSKSFDRKRIFLVTFLTLGLLFFVIGGILLHKVMDHYSAPYFVVAIFYALCQFLYNLGEA